MKKLISMTLVIALVLSLCSVGVFAETTLQGEGTAESPYLITSKADFLKIWSEHEGYGSDTAKFVSGKYFKQTADFTMQDTDISALYANTMSRFAGTYDGNGYTITYEGNSIAARRPLFGNVDSGTIKNLNVDGNMKSTYAGASVIVNNMYGGTIENSSCSVNMHFVGTSNFNYSPYANDADANSYIKNCVYNGKITHGGQTIPDAYVPVKHGYISPIFNSGTGSISDFYFDSDIQSYLRVRTALIANSEIEGTTAKSTKDLKANLLNDYIMKNNRTDLKLWKDTANGPKVCSDYNITLSGSGSEADPYLITNATEFVSIFNNATSGKYFKQTNNFRVSTRVLYEVRKDNDSSKNYFDGTYDGDGHTITVSNLDDGTTKLSGRTSLFHGITNTVKNLNVAGEVAFKQYSYGVLARWIKYPAVIENCNISVDVTINGTQSINFGAYAYAWENDGKAGKATIKNCAFTGTITAVNLNANSTNVGISPFVYSEGSSGSYVTFENCYYIAGTTIQSNSGAVSTHGTSKTSIELNAELMNTGATLNMWTVKSGEALPSVSNYAKNAPEIELVSKDVVTRSEETGYEYENRPLFKFVKSTYKSANIVSCEDAAGIVAYYDQVGDTLRFMDAVIYTVNANNIQNVVKNVNYDVTKVFLWDDLQTISPLTEAETIQ